MSDSAMVLKVGFTSEVSSTWELVRHTHPLHAHSPAESETLRGDPATFVLLSPPGDSGSASSLRTTEIRKRGKTLVTKCTKGKVVEYPQSIQSSVRSIGHLL